MFEYLLVSAVQVTLFHLLLQSLLQLGDLPLLLLQLVVQTLPAVRLRTL